MKEFLFSKALTRWLWQHLPDYDVVDNHYLFSYAPTCAAAIAHHHRIPYTSRTMGQLSPWALAQSHRKKQLYAGLIQRRQLNQAAAIHVTAAGESSDVRRFGIKTPIIHLPLGVTSPAPIPNAQQQLRQRYALPEDSKVLLFLSRLHYKKRPELVIQAVAKLRARGHNCYALIAGSGEAAYEAQLKALAIEAGVSTQVKFTGFVEGTEKDLLLQGADLFVLPSYSENFGIAVAEALAAGLPIVISPDIQIAPEIAAAKAGCIVPAELSPLVDELAALLRSPARRRALSQQGQQLAKERYSWRTIALSLYRVYEKIAAGLPLYSNEARLAESIDLESITPLSVK